MNEDNIDDKRMNMLLPFCNDEMYMTMFMDGFQMTLLGTTIGIDDDFSENNITTTGEPQRRPYCLNYFVSSWKLNNSNKFIGAMVFTCLLAIIVEALSSLRHLILHHPYWKLERKTSRSRYNQSSSFGQQQQYHKRMRLRHQLSTLCYSIQCLLGYILMLITMSFSIELFGSVIIGLMIGDLLFTSYDDDNNNNDDLYYCYNDTTDTNANTTTISNRHNGPLLSSEPTIIDPISAVSG